jgi:hypothetical protein
MRLYEVSSFKFRREVQIDAKRLYSHVLVD